MLNYKLIIVFVSFICEVFSQNDKLDLDSDSNIQNFVIEISRDLVNYDKELIDSIKKNMIFASKALYTATNNLDDKIPGIKFGKIYISLPSEWKSNYSGLINEFKSKPHFKIYPQKQKSNISKPFTKQIKKCGSQGEYSVFSNLFFKSTDQNNLIRNGKRIMREFVKFRYGVFSEKPYKNILFVHDDQKFIKGICNENIEWEVNGTPEQCSDKNSICKYTIKKNQTHTYSVMFDTDTPSSEFFCNDKDRPHNSQAYNLHNIICKGKSVSSVILQHKDFAKKMGPKKQYVDPTFEIVFQTGRQFVFVLDISGSMNSFLNKTKMIVEKFIKTIENSAEIGIVTFNHRASIISKPVKVNEFEQQNNLINKVKNISCYGFSSISTGLKEGMQVLTGYPPKKFYERKSIILLTDEDRFENTNEEYYSKIMLILSKSGIILHVISFDKKSDSILKKLSEKTEGSYQVYKSSVAYEKLFKKMIGKFRTKDKGIMLYSEYKKADFTYTVEHDNNYSIITVNVKKNLKKYNMTLSYSDVILNPITVTNKRSSSKLVFKTLKQAEPGKYLLIFTKITRSSKTKHHKKQNKNNESIKVIQFSLSGKQNDLNKRTVNPIGEISITSIDMLVATSSIKITIDLSTCGITEDERVQVKLEIQSQSMKIAFKEMKDDGFGEDFMAGDKIYTKNIYSKNLLEKGFYTFYGHVEIINKISGETIGRTVMFENLNVKDVDESATTDKISPAQMIQPTISIINSTTIKLKTIATGDDDMEGQINKYQILVRSTTEYVLNKTNSAKPYEAISFLIDLVKRTDNALIQILIRGVDKSDNVGEWSVAAPVKF